MSKSAVSCARILRVVLWLALAHVSGAETPAAAEVKAQAGTTATNRTPAVSTTTNRAAAASAAATQGAIQVVETPTHVFRFYRNARVEVSIKKGEDFIGEPIGLTLVSGYADATKEWKARPIKEYVQEPEWDAKRQSVSHQMLLEDNVRVDVYYQVKNGVLYTGLSAKEPAGISYPGSYSVLIVQPAVLTYDSVSALLKGWPAPEGVTPEKLAATLKGMQVSIKCKKANQVIYPYAKGIPRFVFGQVDEVAVAGVYGTRVVTLVPPAANGFLSPYIYSGNAPYQGYSCTFYKKDLRLPASNSSEQMRLSVK